MSKCDFTFSAPGGDAVALLERARSAISQNGGTIDGNNSTGAFSLSTPIGNVKGVYAIEGDSIRLSITDKPLLVGCGKIEQKLQEYLNS